MKHEHCTEDSEFARQLLETDQPLQIDAPSLTRDLVALRKKRKKAQRVRLGVVAGASVVGLAALLVFGPQFLRPNADAVVAIPSTPTIPEPDSPLANRNPQSAESFSTSAESLGLTGGWEFGEREVYQRKLAALKSEIAEMRDKNSAQQLTLLKENISRTFFDEINAESTLTNY
jgi:hypothetical protein